MKVLILMSTFNGERYIPNQLDSILNQHNVDITLLIRDDNSKDQTLDIIQNYINKFPNIKLITGVDNCGCKQSFFNLMFTALQNYADYDYFAFADQDDIWEPNKISSGVTALSKINNPYKIYYCDPLLVNSNLEIIRPYHYNAKNTLGESFVLQPCIGCSMIFSKAVLEKAVLGDPTKYNIHDAWLYQVNLALGGVVIHDSNCLIQYRQHTNNVIGYNQSFLKKWNRRFQMFLKNSHTRSNQAKELLSCLGNSIPVDELKQLSDMANYRNSISAKLRILFSKKYLSNKTTHNIMFKLAILLNRI